MKTPHTHLTWLAKITLLCLSLLLLATQSYARDLTFKWLPNPEQIIGYKLYYKTGVNDEEPYDGTGINEGDSPITIGNVTTFTVTGLSPNETYHFTLKAYDDTEESGYSRVASYPPSIHTSCYKKYISKLKIQGWLFKQRLNRKHESKNDKITHYLPEVTKRHKSHFLLFYKMLYSKNILL